MKPRQHPVPVAFVGLSGLLLIYLLLPLTGLLPYLSWHALRSWLQPQVLAAVGVSAAASTVAMLVLGLLGVPLAYLLARREFVGKGLISLLVQVPLAVPPVVSGILLLMVFGPYAPLGSWLASRGFLMTDSLLAIIAAQIFVSSPFVIIPARAAFEEIDRSLEEVATTLGKSPRQIFAGVVLPMAWPAIVSALTLAWVRALGEFGATAMVAYHPYSLPVLAWVRFQEAGLENTVPLVLLMLAVGAMGIGLSCVLRRPAWRRLARRRPPVAETTGLATHDPSFAAMVQTAGMRAAGVKVEIAHQVGDLELAVQFQTEHQRIAILGPSGSGKSITLKALAGLETPSGGRIEIGGRLLFNGEGSGVTPAARRVGYVPQQFALFPHMTVQENVEFAQAGAEVNAVEARQLLELMGLERLTQHYPGQLSYGQQQRVALARALARRPDYLLLDEPFTALDTPLRLRLRQELLRILQRLQIPVVLVTHDPEEAFDLAQEIVVMAEGRVLQHGARAAVCQAPASPQVAELLGIRNTFRGQVVSSTPFASVIRYQSSTVFIPAGEFPVGAAVDFFANPRKLALAAADEAGSRQQGAAVDAVVDLVWPRANGIRCLVAVGEGKGRDYWEVDLPGNDPRAAAWQAGDPVRLLLPSAAIHLMRVGVAAA